MKKYLGRAVRVMTGEIVTIKTIQASLVKPTRFEINGEHHVVMLDFFKQMNNDHSITQEQINEFDNIEAHVERMKPESDKAKNLDILSNVRKSAQEVTH